MVSDFLFFVGFVCVCFLWRLLLVSLLFAWVFFSKERDRERERRKGNGVAWEGSREESGISFERGKCDQNIFYDFFQVKEENAIDNARSLGNLL